MKTAVLAIVTALVVGCGAAPSTVELSPDWPSEVEDYYSVTERWSRSGRLHSGAREHMDRVIAVSATYHSPEWRTAYVHFRRDRELLPESKVPELLAKEKEQASKHHELVLLVSTYNRRENDLQKGDRSVWRVALVDDQGTEVEATEIKSDRRPHQVLKNLYPRLGDFDEVYVAKFPRESIDILRPGAKQFSLKVAGTRGGVELFWKAP